MKKFIIWTSIITLICFAIGIVINLSSGNFRQEKKEINISKSESIDGVDYLDISSTSANIKLEKTDGKEMIVNYTGQLRTSQNEEPSVSIERKDSKLTIKSGMKDVMLGLTFFDNFLLEIKIPEKVWNEISVKSVSGDIAMSSLNANKYNIENTSGNLDFTDCLGDQHIKTVSGDIKVLDKVLQSNKYLSTTSGDISLFLPADGNFSLAFKTVSGDISNSLNLPMMQSDKRHATAKAGDGKYTISVDSVSGDLIF